MPANQLRFRVQPRDIPPEKAARRLGLTLAEFNLVQDELYARGFPRPDRTTGRHDLYAIEAWMDRRSGLQSDLTEAPRARDAQDVCANRIAQLGNGQG